MNAAPPPPPARHGPAEEISAALAAVRAQGPLVHCLTNSVVTGFTANVLLAAGMAPAMVDNPLEAGEFAGVASAVLVNLGTPQVHTVESMKLAATAARAAGTPWVLDPVAVGAIGWRTTQAAHLVGLGPAIIRGNASEIIGLNGGAGGRGVDSADESADALGAARQLALDYDTVVAVSGATDYLTDGARTLALSNGVDLMTRVTGVGCALGGLMAGFAAATEDRLIAAAAATTLMCLAAEDAPQHGPGSFAVGLLDQLFTLTPADLAARATVREE